PGAVCIVNLDRIVPELRVAGGGRHAELYAPFLPWLATHETLIIMGKNMPFDRVPDIVAEGGDILELRRMAFQRPIFKRQRAVAGRPAFSIYEYGGVDLMQGLADQVHGFDVVDAHQ